MSHTAQEGGIPAGDRPYQLPLTKSAEKARAYAQDVGDPEKPHKFRRGDLVGPAKPGFFTPHTRSV